MLGIPVGGFVMLFAGVLLTNGVGVAMHATSTPEFCGNACHYMRDFVVPEVAESVHGSNASGVRATCPDCHVPQPFLAKTMRKIEAAREGWGHLRGIINTREKYEAHRAEMAERVWATMKRTDSRECRTCHDFSTMKFEDQDRFAARKHQAAMKSGETCIDCHKGVAHRLPEEAEEADEAGAASEAPEPASSGDAPAESGAAAAPPATTAE
jgi:nitrate/TMAO reductase-like tetraheme cytochrome c subunit